MKKKINQKPNPSLLFICCLFSNVIKAHSLHEVWVRTVPHEMQSNAM